MAESVRSARWLGALRAGLLAACLAASAQAQQAAPPPAPQQAKPLAADPALESRVMALSAELRCLVCQNQTIADSNADLAVDLREQVREMLGRGMSDDEIRSYMTDRYGDFVLYNPPLKASTAVLWVGPAVLLVVAVAALLLVLRRRQRLAADAFDPEIPEDDDPPGANR